MAAGPNVLFCMPNRTKCIPLVWTKGVQPSGGRKAAEGVDMTASLLAIRRALQS
jgi:hypothetical protein